MSLRFDKLVAYVTNGVKICNEYFIIIVIGIFGYMETINVYIRRSGNEAGKRGVEFRHSTGNASRNPGNVSVLMRMEYINTKFTGSHSIACYERDISWS